MSEDLMFRFADTPEGRSTFELLHRGFLLGAALDDPLVVAVRAKFDAISRPCECGMEVVAGYPARELNGAQTLHISLEEARILGAVLEHILPRVTVQLGE